MIATSTPQPHMMPSSTAAATPTKAPARATSAIPTDLDGIIDVVGKGLAQLQSLSKAEATGSEVLQSALDKLESASMTLVQGIGGGFTDAVAALMQLQNEQTDDRTSLAKGQIKDKFTKLRAETQKAIKAIQDRMAAAKSSGFWGFFIEVFKVVATAATAVAGVASANPLLIAAAAFAIAGMITSMASDSDAAHWVSVGLGVAGAICGGVGAFVGSSVVTVSKSVEAVLKAVKDFATGVAGGAGGVAAISAVPKGIADGDELEAQADLKDAEAARKRAMKDAAEERDLMKALIETQAQGVAIVSKILRSQNQAEAAAL